VSIRTSWRTPPSKRFSAIFNALRSERRRSLRSVSLDDDPSPAVELALATGNESVEEQVLEGMELALPNGLSREQALRLIGEEFPDASDRRLLLLRQEGERHTGAYSALLGISDRPVGEQRQMVKRAKDRVEKRLQRFRAKLQLESEAGR
jgi:hypothetical protein